MTNIEIREGIKSALARGNTMKQAVNSFINAGYNPSEVEKASKELQGTPFTPRQNTQPIQKKPQPGTNKKPSFQIKNKSQQTGKKIQNPNLKTKDSVNSKNKPIQAQKVSKYESSHPDVLGKKILVFGLISILIVLLVGFGIIFFFREQVSSFLTNLFS